MRQIDLINNIILEEVELANHIRLIKERAVTDWPKVEQLFKQVDKNPSFFAGLETFVFDDPEIGIVQLFSDGTAVINASNKETTWIYTEINNTPTIKVDGEVLDIVKATAQRKKKQATQKTQQQQAAAIASKAPSTIDNIQTAMDWLGFIPGFGDIIDAANSIIYFARGNYLEGTLSLVAIIPIVGSGIKLGMKGALQTIGGMRSASKLWVDAAEGSTSSISALTKFYRESVASGKLTTAQLKLIAKKGDSVSNILLKGKKYFGPNIDREIDRVIKTINNTVVRPVKESFASKVVKSFKSAKSSKASSRLFSALNIGSVGTLGTARNILRKYGVGERELKLLKDAMDVRWAKRLASSPDRTALVLLSNPKLSSKQAASIGLPPWLQLKSYSNVRDWLANVKETDPLKWKQISDYIAKTSTDNKLYQAFVDDSFAQASNIFRPGAVFTAGAPEMFSKIIKLDSYRLSNPKNVDIVYNELNDFAEKIGWDTQDDPNGVIMPALYMLYKNYLKSYVEAPIATATGVAAGLGLGGETAVETPAETETISTAGSDIKTDFKNAGGKTTERLQTLQDKGYSEEQILLMKRELGIE